MQEGTSIPQNMIYLWQSFDLGELAKYRKATVSFFCVSLTVRPHGKFRFHRADFH